MSETNNFHKEAVYYNCLNIALQGDFLNLEKLKQAFESYENIWFLKSSQQTEQIKNFPRLKETIISYQHKLDPEKEFAKLSLNNVNLILLEQDSYPSILKQINHAPLGLYIKGQLPKEPYLALAIVGTRRPSYYGKQAAEQISSQLSQAGAVIVSGLAWGTDTICHKACLKNKGQTIAVLGSGLDIIYPPVNKKLAQEITASGCIISEYSLNTLPLKHHFPLRNRIISGLSSGTIVIEAPLKSGSLITSRFALDQNREVFAIPGPINSNLSVGTNKLIQQGAKLITCAKDVLEEFGIDLPQDIQNKMAEIETKQEKEILSLFDSSEIISIDKIIEVSNLKAAEAISVIIELENKGYIKNTGNGQYIIKK